MGRRFRVEPGPEHGCLNGLLRLQPRVADGYGNGN